MFCFSTDKIKVRLRRFDQTLFMHLRKGIFKNSDSFPHMHYEEMNATLDAYEKPPEHIRVTFKKFQKLKGTDLDSDAGLLDLQYADEFPDVLTKVGIISRDQIIGACAAIEETHLKHEIQDELPSDGADCPIFEHNHLPGKLNLYTIGTAIA